MKICTKCHIEKPKNDFNKRSNSKDGLRFQCRICQRLESGRYLSLNSDALRAKNRQWCKNNPDKVKNQDLRGRYGISLEQYRTMALAQSGLCAICLKIPTGSGLRECILHVDHEHVDGFNRLSPIDKQKYIRGLLCSSCNRGLGYLSDDPQLLRRAANYISSDTEDQEWS